MYRRQKQVSLTKNFSISPKEEEIIDNEFLSLYDNGIIDYEGIAELLKNKVTSKIITRTANYLANEKDEKGLIIKSFAGSGKSFLISLLLASIKDKEEIPFIYMTKNHQITKEFSERYQMFSNYYPDFFLFKGKGYVDEEGNRECEDDIGFKLIKKYGRNDMYCKDGVCPLYNTCKHRQKIADMLLNPTPVSIAGHFLLYDSLYEILKKRWKKDYILIFDEDMSSSFEKRQVLSKNRLLETIQYIKNPQIKEVFKDFIDLIYETHKAPDLATREAIFDKYEKMFINKLDKIKEKKIRKELNKYDKVILKNFNTKNELQYSNPLPFLKHFKLFLTSFRDQENSDPCSFIKVFGDKIWIDYFRILDEENNFIILNATYEPEIFKRFIKKNVKIDVVNITKPFGSNQKIYRVKGRDSDERYATYPLKSLATRDYDGEGKRVWKETEKFTDLVVKSLMFAQKHEKTVIFCIKKLKKLLENKIKELSDEDILNKKVFVDSYSWAIGKNDYQDFDGCVLFGTPYPNVFSFKRKLELYHGDEKAYFKNEVVNKMIQALYRIRPVSYNDKNNKFCEVLSLSSIPIEEELEFEKGNDIIIFEYKDFRKKVMQEGLSKKGSAFLKILKNKKISCFNVKKFQEEFNISRKTALKYIKELINNGNLLAGKDENSKSHNKANLYFLT